jgi:hypothetical protein
VKQLNTTAKSSQEREEEKNREKNFLVSFILEILGAFYRKSLSLPMLSYSIMGTALSPVPPSMSHPHRPDLWCQQAIPDALIGIQLTSMPTPTPSPGSRPPMSHPHHLRWDPAGTVPGIDDLTRIFISHTPSPPPSPGSSWHRQPHLHLCRPRVVPTAAGIQAHPWVLESEDTCSSCKLKNSPIEAYVAVGSCHNSR